MEKVFNKLVRDKIPDIITDSNLVPVTRVLDKDEYRTELYKKLLEESNEVIEAKKTEEVSEELADVLEVLRAIAKLNSIELEEIIELADQKKAKRGGFEKHIFLERTYSKGS